MKVLILSCSNGSGHNSAGRAIMEQMEKRGIPCEMRDAIALRSRAVSAIIRTIHVQSALHATWLFRLMNSATGSRKHRVRSLCYIINTWFADPICKYVKENGYDTVICTHMFPALACSHARRKNKLQANIYFVPTDYDCTPYVEETCMDGYFVPHPLLVQEYVQVGLPEEKVHPTGIPVMEHFSVREEKNQARKMLGLPENIPIALFMGGSIGFGKVKAMVADILKIGSPDLKVVVLVGNNRELYEDLADKYGFDKVVPVEYTDRVDLYLDASDVLFSKPGGLSSTEAAARGIPLIHTAPIPGWETHNAAFFEKLGMCRTGRKNHQYVLAALDLMRDPSQIEKMLKSQQQNINARAAKDICDYVLQAGQKEQN